MVFADAGYWIALWNSRDSLHRRAVAIADRLGTTSILTTHMVLTEVLGAMAGMGPFHRRMAVQMLLSLEADPHIEIIPQSGARFRAAVEQYAARNDQSWSLTDCASFMAMEERGITEALAYDRDLEQAGFVALLRQG